MVSANIYSFNIESSKVSKIASNDNKILNKTYFLLVDGNCQEADNEALEKFVEKVVKSPKSESQKLLNDFQACQSS